MTEIDNSQIANDTYLESEKTARQCTKNLENRQKGTFSRKERKKRNCSGVLLFVI